MLCQRIRLNLRRNFRSQENGEATPKPVATHSLLPHGIRLDEAHSRIRVRQLHRTGSICCSRQFLNSRSDNPAKSWLLARWTVDCRPIGRTSESLRQSPQTLVSSQCTDAGTNCHTNAIALLSLFVPVTDLASVKRRANVVTVSWSYPRNKCQKLPTLDKYFHPKV